jgi:hypothetical protein
LSNVLVHGIRIHGRSPILLDSFRVPFVRQNVILYKLPSTCRHQPDTRVLPRDMHRRDFPSARRNAPGPWIVVVPGLSWIVGDGSQTQAGVSLTASEEPKTGRNPIYCSWPVIRSEPLRNHVLICPDPPENQGRVPEFFGELASGKVQHEYVEFASQVIRKRREQKRFGIRGPDWPDVHMGQSNLWMNREPVPSGCIRLMPFAPVKCHQSCLSRI